MKEYIIMIFCFFGVVVVASQKADDQYNFQQTDRETKKTQQTKTNYVEAVELLSASDSSLISRLFLTSECYYEVIATPNRYKVVEQVTIPNNIKPPTFYALISHVVKNNDRLFIVADKTYREGEYELVYSGCYLECREVLSMNM